MKILVVGFRGLFMFWAGIELIYILIKVPLTLHGFIIMRVAGDGKVKVFHDKSTVTRSKWLLLAVKVK